MGGIEKQILKWPLGILHHNCVIIQHEGAQFDDKAELRAKFVEMSKTYLENLN